MQFQSQEPFLHLAYLFQVCLHVLVLGCVFFVGEVDEELGIALDGEAFHPQHRPGPKAGEQAFILCDVVGDLFALLKA